MTRKILLSFVACMFSVWLATGCGRGSDQEMLVAFSDTNDRVQFYDTNPEKNQTQLLDQQQLTNYPTAVPSADRKILYYTGRDKKGLVQLFELNLATKERKQLTDHLANVDFLRIDPKHSKIYMRVVLPGERNFHLATYDIRTQTVDVWNAAEKDLSVKYFDYDPSSDQILSLTYSLQDDFTKVEQANKNQAVPQPPTYHLALFQPYDKKGKEITTINKDVTDVSISTGGKKALFTVADSFDEHAKHTVYQLDLDSGRSVPLFSDSDTYTQMKQAQFSSDGKGIYFLATKENGETMHDQAGYLSKPKAICYYDETTKKISEVWYKTNGVINNYMLLR
jgi:Tol biopolymer transport system component